ncbi:hypothetical protein PISL3812_06884 [Talaromyces islandicus]|uniref:Uncharacterized protein n=1 Tax=Talaromyces islandicus TaxID=28573 RepID=A0A0U1M2R2_TALIS|nr:hypothetical protein PISL3812_06884 [Talaromyces islandicus]
MPIKLPKGFARRKSSGNVLDEVENGGESSFRVFERPGGGTTSFEGGVALKTAAGGRYYNNRPETAGSDNLFAGIEKPLPNNRGSGGTHHSTSTTGVYDSSSSARYSSSSTLPSSTDGAPHIEHAKTFHDIPAPPVPESPSLFSLRAAGRTFSFGTKPARFSTPLQIPQQQTQPQIQPQQVQHQYQQSEPTAQARDRAMTASSASTATATPPRLLDSDFQLSGNDDDNFTNMFENFGKRKSAIQLRPTDSDDVQSKALPIPPQDERPAPINIDRSQHVEPSPYSGNSQTSHDALMNDGNAHIARKSLAPSQSNHHSNMATSPVSVSSESSGPSTSTAFIDDADAAIVRQSLLLSSSKPNPPAASNQQRHESVDEETPLFTNDDITSSARLASQYEQEINSKPIVQNKVMTPAQFEHYRQQRELTRKYSNASKSDSSDENDYDEDEDEAEKSREAARQRRKQEAHLSVYRQQMMKVTGEQAPAMSSLQPPPSASRLTIDQTGVSSPNLSFRMSTLGLPAGRQDGSKSSDGDGEDDEDVPLGILAAHGFPNKLRPPTRLSLSASNPNLRGSVAPGSVSGESGRDARSSLPVFARNLPPDPYYGAGLVNGPVREGLTFGGGNPAYGPGSSGPLHPGGLVGVIANEERARAMRRGSPNAQAAGVPRPYSMANMGQMGPGMPPQQPSPGELAQMQINQQMTEMMQVQVQMMQQMMQMQGQAGQVNPGLMPPPGQFANPGGRPMSTASSYNIPGQDQRTLSLLDPATMSRWNLNRPASVQPDVTGRPGTPQGVHVYAPSIAPSERSNVGMASRYRPVSTVGQDSHMPRTSTLTSTLKPWNNENQRPVSLTPPASSQASNRKSTSMATITVRPVSGQGQHSLANKAGPDDDDDDEGWADMKKKREKKKSSWKMKKETSALGDLLHMVH